MTRRELAIVGVVALTLGLAFGTVVALREPTIRERFDQLSTGMTYDEVVAILGEPERGTTDKLLLASTRSVKLYVDFSGPVWRGRDGSVVATFDSQKTLSGWEFKPSEPPRFFELILKWFRL